MTKKKVTESAETSGLHPAVPDRYPAFLYGSYKLFKSKGEAPE